LQKWKTVMFINCRSFVHFFFLLIDFGLQSLTHDVKLALLQILEDRCAKGSTIIVSQLPVKSRHDYINDAIVADAIMDRLPAKYSKIELKGQSLRRSS